MSNFNTILTMHNQLVECLSNGLDVDQDDVSSLIYLIQTSDSEDLSERQFFRSCLVFWNSSASIVPLPDDNDNDNDNDNDDHRKQSGLGRFFR